jgi:hypothetical protein
MPLVEAGSKVNFITGYTADANDHIDYGNNVWVAQSFPIAATSRLFRCSFRQWSTEVGMPYYYALRHALADGTPTGANIAETHISPQIKETSSPGKWYHIDFISFPELTPGNYALLAYAPDAHFTTGQHHGAQSNPRLYLPGKAFRSTDSGSTWAQIPDTNSLFQIWGYQEPPPPPPPDAIGNWLLTSITYLQTIDGIIIITTTDIPCHLFKRETTTIPQKHVNPIVTRGAVIGTYIDQCFVAYTDVEQQEQGDTLTHTFIQEPWPVCETRWFYFWGTKLLTIMPSASPIFEYHRTLTPTTIIRCYPTTPQHTWWLNGQTWEAVHDPWNGDHFTNPPSTQEYEGHFPYYGIFRSATYFNLTSLPPDAVILGARMTVQVRPVKWGNGGTTWYPDYHLTLHFPNYTWPPTTSDYGRIRDLALVLLSVYFPNYTDPPSSHTVTVPSGLIPSMQGAPIFAVAHKGFKDHIDQALPMAREWGGSVHANNTPTSPTYLDLYIKA